MGQGDEPDIRIDTAYRTEHRNCRAWRGRVLAGVGGPKSADEHATDQVSYSRGWRRGLLCSAV